MKRSDASQSRGTGPMRARSATTRVHDRIRQRRELVLVLNVRSRRVEALHRHVRRMFHQRGFTVTAEHLITDPATQLVPVMAGVISNRPDLLVVGGGDGTAAAVVDHLAHSDTVLGYLPLGTTNNFGRSLGLPLRLDAAVEAITAGRVADVDLGLVNGTHFANLVSIGLSADVAGRTPAALKRRVGRLAYAATAATALLPHRPFVAELSSGGMTWRVRTHQLNIANGHVHAGSRIARDASLEDGLLVAYALGGGSRLSTIRAAVHQALTPWQPIAHKGYLVSTELRVRTEVPLAVDVDGEIAGTTPLHVKVTEAALQVMVPPGARLGRPDGQGRRSWSVRPARGRGEREG